MTYGQAFMLMVKLSGFKLLVRANRLGCDTDLARDAHDILIAHLDEFREDLDRVIALWYELLAERDPDKADDAAYELRDQRIRVEHFWLHNHHPYIVGGWRRHADDAGNYRIADECDYELFGARHWVRRLVDNELCGLRPILDQLAEETGLNIPAVVIYYRPNPDRLAARPLKPFDPDAPIIW
ncbi:hypothetical protein G6L13_25820 [Agrobacterium tumefaciens]|uniref:hypothetical protein n=1 Tax=Agrobacterium tumefaciens TaxID=358 RepID=UPI001572F362|nr:hypothetical protein [Agrobacterium tumefaciens]NTA83904.1 hypothetical protein [Agrobacterium tumefaciens]